MKPEIQFHNRELVVIVGKGQSAAANDRLVAGGIAQEARAWR